MTPPRDQLARRILWGLAAGIAFGLAWRGLVAAGPGLGLEPAVLLRAGSWFARQILDPVGQVFLRLLFFVVIPLVFASLALGVTQLGRLERLGPLAARTFGLFTLNMAVGVALGLAFMNLVQPGQWLDAGTRETLLADRSPAVDAAIAAAARQREAGFTLLAVVEMFMPRNLLGAVVGASPARLGDVLPLILFALLVGAAGTTLPEARRATFIHALETLGDLMTRIVHWALRLAPFAVAALVGSTVMQFGVGYLKALGLFAGGVLAVIALHLFGTMTLLLKLFTRRSPREFFGAVRTILVTAFSTSSSNATLPTTIQVARERLGVSAPTAGFVLPLGATMNMSGTALFEGCVVLFVAQVYGVPLDLGAQCTLLLLSVLSAVAVAGIPGGSLPLIVGLLVTFNLPAEGIALVLGIDRILDMARTALNVGADVVTAVIVDDATRPGGS